MVSGTLSIELGVDALRDLAHGSRLGAIKTRREDRALDLARVE
jgi:hypothetical protein